MTHLLVTNDYPPKIGGIQSYLWELWRRLPSDQFVVLTTSHPDAPAWDAQQHHRIDRIGAPVMIPNPGLIRRINALTIEIGATVVLLDPALPLGMLGRHLCVPYGLVLHGAEITIPGRLPFSKTILRRVLRGAEFHVAAGGYPLAEAERAAGRRLRSVVVPPGVDVDRFHPLSTDDRQAARLQFGLDPHRPLVTSVSRLVPRKGMDTLIRASSRLRTDGLDLQVAIAGGGRDHDRLQRIINEIDAPVRLLGRVDDRDLPAFAAAGDLFAMLCRNRWGGLEQEGFGIVFLEAAACGVAQLAGRSGGSHEAVVDGHTGLVVDDPRNVDLVARGLATLLGDDVRRREFGEAARIRAKEEFAYDVLADQLQTALRDWSSSCA